MTLLCLHNASIYFSRLEVDKAGIGVYPNHILILVDYVITYSKMVLR